MSRFTKRDKIVSRIVAIEEKTVLTPRIAISRVTKRAYQLVIVREVRPCANN